MKRTYSRMLTSCFAVVVLASCASVKNKPAGNVGLAYSLPNRMVDITTDFTDSGQISVSVTGGAYYADPSPNAQSAVQIRRSWIGKNDVKLATSNGLLTSAKATYTGQSEDLAKSIGSVLGVIHGRSVADALVASPSPCNKTASIKHSIPLAELLTQQPYPLRVLGLSNAQDCDLIEISISQLGATGALEPIRSQKREGVGTNGTAGLWYRTNQLYVVHAQAKATGVQVRAPVFLPDQSKSYYIKMQNGVFASSTTELKFSDGMLTSYDRSADSEAIALLKLPAGVIAAYASAVGEVFTNFKSVDTTDANEQLHEVRMLLFMQKMEACKTAVASKQPEATIAELCSIEPPK